jgi:hypothetical protein
VDCKHCKYWRQDNIDAIGMGYCAWQNYTLLTAPEEWCDHYEFKSRLTPLQADRVSSEHSDGEGISHAAA